MLSKFNKSVIIFFCILLIVISLIFFQNFKYLLANTSFPAKINKCPDHWETSGNNKCAASRLNKTPTKVSFEITKSEISPGSPKYKLDDNFDFKNVYKKNNYCALNEYSKTKNLDWSGITNANYTKYC